MIDAASTKTSPPPGETFVPNTLGQDIQSCLKVLNVYLPHRKHYRHYNRAVRLDDAKAWSRSYFKKEREMIHVLVDPLDLTGSIRNCRIKCRCINAADGAFCVILSTLWLSEMHTSHSTCEDSSGRGSVQTPGIFSPVFPRLFFSMCDGRYLSF